jgi:hypothetical protein
MSDPLKKDEIEDVLSSIRRLVSEDIRELAEPEAVAPSAKPAQVAADKLVLSPSLRVEEEDAKPAPAKAEPDGLTTEDLVAQEIAKSITPTEEEQGPRVLTLSKTAADLTDSVEEVATAEGQDAPVAESADEPKVEAEGEWDPKETPAVQWQSVRSYADMEFDPEAAGDGDYAGTEVDALDWGQSAQEAPVQDTTTPEAEAPASEAVIDAEVVSEPQTEDAPYEAVLDEEMLRDLVGEIVRQELQGPLGERITRNVRKLVRREINRALASRQID